MESDYVCLHPSLALSPASPLSSFIISLSPSIAPPRQFLLSRRPRLTPSESYFYARQLPAGYILQPRDCSSTLGLCALHAPPPIFVLIFLSSPQMTSPSLTHRISPYCLSAGPHLSFNLCYILSLFLVPTVFVLYIPLSITLFLEFKQSNLVSACFARSYL